jgi:hypothetical protein
VAAQAAGLKTSLISYEALVDERDAEAAVRHVEPRAQCELAIYRGWMLRPEAYTRLFDALAALGVMLINSPAAYRHCHYLPESYEIIEGRTPLSVWIAGGPEISTDRIMETLRPFNAEPVIVKDFVKSQKHAWDEACYIPSAGDLGAVEQVVRRFLDLQGEDLNEGLVFREFVAFEPLATHSKSGMPLTTEYRLFFLDGQPL